MIAHPNQQPRADEPAGVPAAAPFGAHDHGACLEAGLAAAEAHCAAAGVRLTAPRRRALELLLAGHRALGAYEVLEGLSADGLGSQPPAAYRALEFLTRHGLAHRIERLNAYVACPHPARHHSPAFLICRLCRGVEEAAAADAQAALARAGRGSGFRIEGLVIEAVGLCPACAASEAQGSPPAPPPGGGQLAAEAGR